MNRQTAREYEGKPVLVKLKDKSAYVATLDQIRVVDQKPWQGELIVKAIYTYPSPSTDQSYYDLKILKEGERIIQHGKDILPLPEGFTKSYEDSLINALKLKWDQESKNQLVSDRNLTYIEKQLQKLNAENVLYEQAFVYYEVIEQNGELFIFDSEKNENLPLAGCPFEFEIQLDQDNWVAASFDKKNIFITDHSKRVTLSDGDIIRMNRDQFDPYQILLNDLASPALIALERGLEKLKIGHQNCVYCHNSLLLQMLTFPKKKDYHGVNFISYANNSVHYVILHHYERNDSNNQDHTFDRFEFTSDKGERLLTTYATALSNDSRD